jgi:hypothetical protein
MAKSHHGHTGYLDSVPCCSDEQEGDVRCVVLSRLGMVHAYICAKVIADVDMQMEAGIFQGVILQMSYWYIPDEMSVRLLYFCKSISEARDEL